MNDFEYPNEPKNEITMTESEKKSHKKVFSKLGFAFLSYLVISQGLSLLAGYVFGTYAPHLLKSNEFTLVLSSVIQYLIAFPILFGLISNMPKQAPEKTPMDAKRFLKYGAASMFVMYVGNYLSVMIMSYIEALLGRAPENAVSVVLDNTNVLFTVFIVGIIGPIIEELMFRKLFIDRLTPYGEAVAIFFPSLIFGLFHGNLYQFFYAFFLGAIFSYIYVKTGKIIYSTILHVFINLFCGVLPSAIMGMFNYEEFMQMALDGMLTEEYINANMTPILLLGAYEFLLLGMVGIGIFVFTRNVRNIRINKGEVRFPKGEGADIMFFNVGTVALISACLLLMAYSIFA